MHSKVINKQAAYCNVYYVIILYYVIMLLLLPDTEFLNITKNVCVKPAADKWVLSSG
jgi:hypothetical protein